MTSEFYFIFYSIFLQNNHNSVSILLDILSMRKNIQLLFIVTKFTYNSQTPEKKVSTIYLPVDNSTFSSMDKQISLKVNALAQSS